MHLEYSMTIAVRKKASETFRWPRDNIGLSNTPGTPYPMQPGHGGRATNVQAHSQPGLSGVLSLFVLR
jgi:hypothetical protein